MKSTPYELILLDLDDTLLDFPAAQSRAFNKALSTFNISLTSDLLSTFVSLNHELWALYEKEIVNKEHVFKMRWERLLAPLGFTGDAVAVNACFLDELAEKPLWLDGAEQFCKEVSQHFNICLLSNGDSRTQQKRIKYVGLDRYVKHVVISDEVGVGKPNPKIFDFALNRAGVVDKERVLMIGDNFRADITGALDYGIDACWYNPQGATAKSDKTLTYVAQHHYQITSWLLKK